MNEPIQFIPLTRLALAFIPVCAVLLIIHRWSLGTRAGLVAVLRMVTQLLLVGYVLTFVFESDSAAGVRAGKIETASCAAAEPGLLAPGGPNPASTERPRIAAPVMTTDRAGSLSSIVGLGCIQHVADRVIKGSTPRFAT